MCKGFFLFIQSPLLVGGPSRVAVSFVVQAAWIWWRLRIHVCALWSGLKSLHYLTSEVTRFFSRFVDQNQSHPCPSIRELEDGVFTCSGRSSDQKWWPPAVWSIDMSTLSECCDSHYSSLKKPKKQRNYGMRRAANCRLHFPEYSPDIFPSPFL